MKIRFILVFAVICAAVGFVFSSDYQSGESAVLFGGKAKCAIPKQPAAFEEAAAVFVGEILKEEKNGDVRSFEFRVEKYWKGAKREKIRIDVYETTRYQSWFKTGERYLIYATAASRKGNLRVVRCSRSRAVSEAADDLKQLGKGKNPR